ncbi:hypothetical protein [Fimbriiglobus ruber]|uniref:hypothetical protein n=1 Tax=Fimbriiglobus ruber TaxID=1908690 RepID=UPI00117B5035|nr:hypothetical protein [Fimbriiglobus ruber]
MPNGHVLELSTLPAIHPKVALLVYFAPSLIARLCFSPLALPAGKMTRAIDVEWASRGAPNSLQLLSKEIGWSNIPEILMEASQLAANTIGDTVITEQAAIAVMALLIHDLEKLEILSVLQIGSGGDYLVSLRTLIKRLKSNVAEFTRRSARPSPAVAWSKSINRY